MRRRRRRFAAQQSDFAWMEQNVTVRPMTREDAQEFKRIANEHGAIGVKVTHMGSREYELIAHFSEDDCRAATAFLDYVNLTFV